ncbi:MAG: hypothetical protein ACREJC_15015 [Tepidisphaeraceae bacterium]
MANQQQAVDFEIQMDLTDTREFGGDGAGGPEVPPGEYVLDIIDLKQDTSSNNNPMVVVTFEVVEGGEEDSAGKQLTGWYTLTEKAAGRMKKLQMAAGARIDAIRSSELRGARIRATVLHQDGEQRFKPDGTPWPVRVFAKVVNERPLEDAPVEQAPAPTPPPVTRATTKNNGATRRA